MYLDRAYVLKNKQIPVYDMGLTIFKKYVAREGDIREKFISKILSEIQRERNGELIDQEVIKGVLTMLVELGLKTKKVYEEDFERRFLNYTVQFYREESNSLI